MSSNKRQLNWTDLNNLTQEVMADDGPGSAAWNPKGSETERINNAFMQALRDNGGRVPGELADVPALIITTIGAKSGRRRAIPLAYQVIEDRLLIIASMGGAKRNPPWFYNLVKNPTVTVERDGETFEARAVVTLGDDRDHLFQHVAKNFPIFADYQARTERVIPVVELIHL